MSLTWMRVRRRLTGFTTACPIASKLLLGHLSSMRPAVNGILETSLYVDRPTRSVEFYRRVFGFELIAPEGEITDDTRLCAMQAGDRSVLLLFKKGGTRDTDADGSIHVAFAITNEFSGVGGVARGARDPHRGAKDVEVWRPGALF